MAIESKNPYAEVVIEQLGSQIDLCTTLATAIIGGLVALAVQIAIHNRSTSGGVIVIRCKWLILLALICELLSLFFAYLARGTVTDIVPILMQLSEDAWMRESFPIVFKDVRFEHSYTLAIGMMFQFFTLFSGVISIILLAWFNRALLQSNVKS